MTALKTIYEAKQVRDNMSNIIENNEKQPWPTRNIRKRRLATFVGNYNPIISRKNLRSIGNQ